MSYCRWSCLDHTCDVYAYESEDGYQIHLSSKRRMGPHPFVPWEAAMKGEVSTEELHHIHVKYLQSISDAALIDNNLPDADQSYSTRSLSDFYFKLIELRNQGFNFPSEVLDTICRELFDAGRLHEITVLQV